MSESAVSVDTTYEEAFKSSAIGMAIVSREGKFLKVNKALSKLLGYNQKEFSELSFLSVTHQADKASRLKLFHELLEGKIKTIKTEKRYIHKNGHVVWVLLNISPIYDKNKKIKYFISSKQDITKQKDAELSLHKSQERLDSAVKGAEIGLWDWDIDTDEIYWSDVHKKLLGIKDKKFLANRDEFIKRIHPEDKDILKQAVKDHLENKKPYDLKFRLLHSDGHYIWIHSKGRAFFDKEGNPIRMAGSAYDISETKKIEEDLKITRERFDLALKGSSVGLWDWDLETGEVRCSDRKLEILKAPKKKNFRLFFKGWEKRLHPKDLPVVAQSIEKHLKKGVPLEVEYRFKGYDGKYVWLSSKGQAIFDKDKNPIRISGSTTDISEKKETAYKLQTAEGIRETIIDSSYDGYWDWHIQEDYEYMSPKFWQMFGYKPEEKKHHPSEWQKIIVKESLEEAIKNYQRHVDSKGKHPYLQEVKYYHKDGHIIHVLCRGKVIEWDSEGKPVRMVGTHTDLTELRNTQKKLIEYTNKLEKSNEALDYFAYIASHDLKEPLRGLSNNALFLKEDYADKLDEKANQRIERMRFLCSKMENMINDLFHFSRLKNQDLAWSNVDIKQMVEEIKETFEENNVSIKISKNIPETFCDQVTIRELFRNLIANAIKYNDKDIKIIEVGFKKNHDSRKNVFFVKDNGIGIEKKFFGTIFEIFKRLENRDDQGTGFGLSLVKKIVENHHGEIWLESKKNIGTIFYFTLNNEM